MQFKLLQSYKTLSNLSLSLIMEFIPFMILDNAQPVMGLEKALMLMFVFWALQYFFLVIFNYIFKKQFFKRPQIFLLLRIIPIICCEICILFLSTNSIWIIILTALFSGLENSFNNVPIEIIYNYVSKDATEKTLGFTRFLEQAGWFIAGIIGGFFLDNISHSLVVAFSLAMFICSAIPLFVFYFKFKNSPNFNSDFICSLAAQDENSEEYKKLKKSFLIKHFLTNLLISPLIDTQYYLASTIIYIRNSSYFIEGLVNSLYDGIVGISSLLIGKILTKFDGKNLATISGVLIIIASTLVITIPNDWVIYCAYLCSAFIIPFITLYLYQNFLDKGRVLGVGNEIINNQVCAENLSYGICFFAGWFGGMLVPVAIVGGAMSVIGLIFARKTDETTTNNLVDYLNQNE